MKQMNWNRLESRSVEGDRPVQASLFCRDYHLSRAGHVESCLNLRRPCRKAKYSGRPIVDQYREGKVGSTPNRGVK